MMLAAAILAESVLVVLFRTSFHSSTILERWAPSSAPAVHVLERKRRDLARSVHFNINGREKASVLKA